MPLSKNDSITLEITALSNEGAGVGRFDGQAVFVPVTCPGDIAQVKIVKPMKSYAFGVVEQVLSPSENRVENDCPAFPKCGGCNFRHISYEKEKEAKEGFVRDAMKRIGKTDAEILPILASPKEEAYRNKAVYPLGITEEGKLTPGFFAERTHRLIPCQSCRLQPQVLNDIAVYFCELAQRYHLSAYQEEAHRGLLRSLYLRIAETTGQIMVCIVLNGQELPHAGQICEALIKKFPAVTTLVINHNTQRTNVVLGPRSTTLYGSGVIQDTLCGLLFDITPQSFYQVNREGAELLYGVARQYADLHEGDTLLDLYCGVGTIGLSMAQDCSLLIGVEIVPSAVEMARLNAKRAGIEHCRFLQEDAGKAAQTLAQENANPDVVIMDPPRKGCDLLTLQSVLKLSPSKIVMVSCNPATAARDVAFLEENGYCACKVQPVDMFPRTKHVETVVLLSHKNADTHINVTMEFGEGEGKIPTDKIAEKADECRPNERVTYKMIKEYVESKYGFKVHTANIAEVKRSLGLPMYDAPNAVEELKTPYCSATPEKIEAIKDTLKYFEVI